MQPQYPRGFLGAARTANLTEVPPASSGILCRSKVSKGGHQSAGINREGANDRIYQDTTVAMVKPNSP